MFGERERPEVVGVAFVIGTIEILGIFTTEFHLNGGFWNLMANFNINVAGFCIAGMFVLVWAVALIYWKVGQVETKWTENVAPVAAGSSPAADPQ